MKKNRITLLFVILFVVLLGCNDNHNLSDQNLTGINTLSYTDVVFYSEKDTVLVSTYSGRISKRIKNQDDEKLVIQLNDEVYSLQFLKSKNAVIASTLNSGVLIIDVSSGLISKQLKTNKNAWINSIKLSNDDSYLLGFDTKGNNYIWDLNNGYQKLDLTKALAKSYIRHSDKFGALYFQKSNKYVKWNINNRKIEKEYSVDGKLTDIDDNGDLLLLNFNEFQIFGLESDSIIYKRKHPYYIYKFQNGDTLHDPYHLKLTDALFGKSKIYTSSLDQSIRVWNKTDGRLIDEWYTHNGTISALDIADNQKQMVSVDLKGKIKFWNLD
ncbi:hypothetical protein [Polaribacter porphyrae]|uniref:Target of rapamycin complex subunit LST8 n=1 Tax=Polaribacter porphyrae TaxID=1137780 RepID=A0A2S7WQL3_9FLAO|nr:hypothetical protein [Polaribacter porphyrae]PQJ79873.1 hypothetical protein BTO18_12115 [Polaribacter porphyrae]